MSIRLRLTLSYTILLAFTLIILSILLYFIQSTVTLGALTRALTHNAIPFVNGERSFETSPDALCGRWAQTRNPDGSIIARTPDLGDNLLPLSDSGLRTTQSGTTWTETALVGDEKLLIFSQPVIEQSRVVQIVQVGLPLTEQDQWLSTLRSVMLIGDGMAILAAFIIGWLLAGMALGPIHQITQTAQAIGTERNFTRRVEHRGPNDEVGQLATTFNRMLIELESTHRQAEEHSAELAQQKYMLDVFMDTVPDWIYFKDCAGRFTRVNQAHAKRHGFSDPAAVVGKSDFDLISLPEAQKRYDEEQRIIQTGQSLTYEVKHVQPNGQTDWAITTKMPLRAENGNIVGTFGITHDITALNRMLTELESAHRQLESSLQAQRRFVADASHELRTPMTTIRGNVELLRREPPLERSEQVEVLADTQDEAERVIRLVNQLLELAQMDAGQPLNRETFFLLPLMDEVCRQAKILAPQKNIHCETSANVQVLADRDALKQVLLILIDNAIVHTPPSAMIHLTVQPNEQRVVIQVQDTGPGIAPESLPHIFERFYRGAESPSGSGTGLGLAIARELIQAQGGTLTATSEIGKGSTFTVTLSQAVEKTQQIG